MQLRVVGKLTAVEKFNRKLQRFADATDAIADGVAEEAMDLIAEGFAGEKDPYGNKWADKVHDDGRSILVGKTTRLRRGWHVIDGGPGKRSIAPNVEYAIYHQDGTNGRSADSTRVQPINTMGRFLKKSKAAKRKTAVGFRILNFKAGGGKIPARPMIPDSRGVPSHWRTRAKQAANEVIKLRLR